MISMRKTIARIAAVLAAAAITAVSCTGAVPGPGHCQPGYHHRLANQDPAGPWCIRNGS